MKKTRILFLINTICLLILIILLYIYFNLDCFFLYDFSNQGVGKFFINEVVISGLKELEALNSRFSWQDIIYHGIAVPKPINVEPPSNPAEIELAKLSEEELWHLYLKYFDTDFSYNIKDMDHYGYIYGHPEISPLETRPFSFERCYKMFPEMIRKDSDTQRSLEAEKMAIGQNLEFATPPPPWDKKNSGSTVWMKKLPDWYQHAQERWELNKQIVANQYKDGIFMPIFAKDRKFNAHEEIAKTIALIAYASKRLMLGAKQSLLDDIIRMHLQMSKWDAIDEYYGKLSILLITVYFIIFFVALFHTTISNFILKYFYEVRFALGTQYFIWTLNYYLETSIKPHTEEYKLLTNDAIIELKRCRELQAYNLSEEDLKILLKKLSNFLFYCSNHPFTHERIYHELLEPLKVRIPRWSRIVSYNDFFKKNPKKLLISRIFSFKWFKFSTFKPTYLFLRKKYCYLQNKFNETFM